MDNFMSKLSQKINAQDTIKANFMADTAEKEHMKKQLQEYDAVLQSMRNLYLTQEENSELFKRAAEKLDAMDLSAADKAELLPELKEMISKSDEFTHKECVKVYRNVQALLEEQNKKAEESTEEIKAQVESAKPADISGDLEAIKGMLEANQKGIKANRVWLLFAVLFLVADLVCILLIHFGLF